MADKCKTPGKLRYPSRQAATQAALEPQRNIGLPLMAYRCPGGPHWHLSTHHQTKPARRR